MKIPSEISSPFAHKILSYWMLDSILRWWDEIINMVLDLFTCKNPEKNSEEVGEEEIQPDMTTCPEVVYCNVEGES